MTNLRGALRVWPNPVPGQGQGQVTWDLPEAVTGSAQLTLVSAAGQVMGTWPVALAEQGHTLDLGSTSPGLYHVHLVVEGRWVSGARVVVQ
ncbi:MAG: T9SS type A sorting domain-containing protein [Flavobacteriales bacterium]|nr:T9SS type A sorting domain-containing protein [Flavobacteriales bacterium]